MKTSSGLKAVNRTVWFSICLLFIASAVSFGQQGATALDPVMKAMSDELDRSIAELKLNDLDKPYFVQYVVIDQDEYDASATFGALTGSDRGRQRIVQAQVRVGNYDFDNSEFAEGAQGASPTGVLDVTTIDDDYSALRHTLWLATDSAYKQSVEILARKRAFVQNKNQEEQPPDFSKENPTRAIAAKRTLEIDKAKLETQLRDWSKIFRDYPSIQTSSLGLRARMTHRYVVNSEGTRTLQPELLVSLQVSASTQATDGMQISHTIPFNARSFDELPSPQAITAAIKQMAADLTALRTAPVLDANYSGPVLLTGQASAEMFARILAPGLSGQRGPMTNRAGQSPQTSALADRINRPVLPSNLSVVDDPSEQRIAGLNLIGHYAVDDQGVPAQKLSLVESGLLTDLLMSRRPAKDHLQSNGHGRNGLPGRETAQISNLLITASGGKTYDELKAELLQSCKTERLAYCIVIKALNPNGPAPMGTPVLTYKIFVADGHEELVRGASVGSLPVQSLRHIQATGNDAFVENRLIGTRGYETPVSVVAPSVLLEELELDHPAGTQTKPATLTHPFFSN